MAIIIDRKITINNDQATLDRPIYLYIEDGDITCLFTIEEKRKRAATFGSKDNNNYSLPINEDTSYGQVRIYKPDPGSDAISRLVLTDRAEIIDDKLQVTFSRKNIDDFSEAGIHKLQIHLYDNEDNRFTIPPVDLYVLMPVGCDNNTTGEAIVGYSLLDRAGEEVPTFDEEGNYNKTVWETGDIITSNKLNKIEDALRKVTEDDDNFVTNEVLEAELANKADEGHNHNSLYATKAELNNKAPSIHTHTNYASTTHGHSGVYAPDKHTHSEYATTNQLMNHSHSGYALTGHNHDGVYAPKSDIPTRLGQLANDKGYITSTGIPDNYPTKDDIKSYNYADKSYVDNNFATTSYVIDAINKAQIPEGDTSGIDLSAYALRKDLITGLAGKADDNHNHDGRYLTTATLDGYASKAYVDNAVGNIGIDPSVLAEYAKIENVPTKVTDLDDGIYYATKEDVSEAVKNVQVDLTDYATTEAVNNALANKADEDHNHDDKYAKIDDIPTVPTKLSDLENDKGYAKTTEIDKAVSDLDKKISDKDYATKSEIPTNITDLEDHEEYAKKTDIPTNIINLEGHENYALNESVNAINRNLEDNYATRSEIEETLGSYVTVNDMPTSTNDLTNDSGYITSNKDDDGRYCITRIEVVDQLPGYEEPGVLYIVKA